MFFHTREFKEVGKAYANMDFSLQVGTPDHDWYHQYATCMAVLYPLGIPAVYYVVLLYSKSKFCFKNGHDLGMGNNFHNGIYVCSFVSTTFTHVCSVSFKGFYLTTLKTSTGSLRSLICSGSAS